MIIYPPDQFVQGKIPHRENFPRAARRFQRMCIDDFVGGVVRSFMVYGSFSRGDHSRASDIDTLIVVNDRTHMDLVSEGVSVAFQEEGVAIQTRFIVIGKEADQPLESNFHIHFRYVVAKEEYLGENPLNHITQSRTPPEIAARITIAAYQGALRNKYVSRGIGLDAHMRFLKMIAEKPFHAMRELLHCSPQGIQGDAKASITEQFRSTYPHIASLVEPLRNRVHNYVQILEHVDEMRVLERKQTYAAALKDLGAQFFDVDRFYQLCIIEADKLIASKPL